MQLATAAGGVLIEEEIKRRILIELARRAALIAAEQTAQTVAVASVSWVPILGQVAVILKVIGYVLTAVSVLKIISMAIAYLNSNGTTELTGEAAELIRETREEVKVQMATETQTKTQNQRKEDDSDDEDGPWVELHKSWSQLDHYRGGVRRAVTYKYWPKKDKKKDTKNMYYYEQDTKRSKGGRDGPVEIEVYSRVGCKGIHTGVLSVAGGKYIKPAVIGRTIEF